MDYTAIVVLHGLIMPNCHRANPRVRSAMIGERMGEWLREGIV